MPSTPKRAYAVDVGSTPVQIFTATVPTIINRFTVVNKLAGDPELTATVLIGGTTPVLVVNKLQVQEIDPNDWDDGVLVLEAGDILEVSADQELAFDLYLSMIEVTP